MASSFPECCIELNSLAYVRIDRRSPPPWATDVTCSLSIWLYFSDRHSLHVFSVLICGPTLRHDWITSIQIFIDYSRVIVWRVQLSCRWIKSRLSGCFVDYPHIRSSKEEWLPHPLETSGIFSTLRNDNVEPDIFSDSSFGHRWFSSQWVDEADFTNDIQNKSFHLEFTIPPPLCNKS